MFFLWGQLRYPRGGCFRYADFLYAFIIADFEPKFLYKILENRDKKFLYKISLFCHVDIEFDRRYMCWNTVTRESIVFHKPGLLSLFVSNIDMGTAGKGNQYKISIIKKPYNLSIISFISHQIHPENSCFPTVSCNKILYRALSLLFLFFGLP